MAVKDFKNIDTRTAFRVLEKDRAIIERGKRLSNFGSGKEDFIEFTLYDASDNQLPQGESGELTRHISLNQLNINEYFLTKDSGDGVVEYFVDIEKLIREAGYNQGLFKIQFQLLNNRVGRFNTEKMFIHEISPSRTEARLVPVTNADGTIDEELFRRYDGFAKGKTFRDDVIYYIDDFLDSIKFRNAIEKIVSKFGKKYLEQIKTEFKINDFEEFINQVTIKLKESIRYYVEGRDYNPKSPDYGKPLPAEQQDDIFLDINELLKNILRITCDIVDILLPKRNIQDDNFITSTFDESVDIREYINTITSDTTYEGESDDDNTVDDYTDEDVEDEEEEIINTPSSLTVSPAQGRNVNSDAQQVEFEVTSTSNVTVSFEFQDESLHGNKWAKSLQLARGLPAGTNTFRLKVSNAGPRVIDRLDDRPRDVDPIEPRGGGITIGPNRGGGGGGGSRFVEDDEGLFDPGYGSGGYRPRDLYGPQQQFNLQ